MLKKGPDQTQTGILGDINPAPPALKHDKEEDEHSMEGGSNHGESKHAGSRDVTEGTTGGTGAEVGGSRNYRTGTGATGGDIGNRPE